MKERRSSQKNLILLSRKKIVLANDRDLRSIVAQVVAANPRAVFVAFANPGIAFAFFKQLWTGGYRGTRFASIDYDDKYLKEFGKITEGIVVPGAFTGKFSSDFAQRYQAHYHEEPDVYSAEAYDLLRTAIQSLEANNWSPVNLKERIFSINYSNTAIPGFRFNTNRTVEFPMGVLIAKDGHFVPLEE